MPDRPAPTDAECAFASAALTDLLHVIEVRNANADPDWRKGRYSFQVSHAWTDGATTSVVYTAPPSDRVWGLVRDTRHSLIDPGPWSAGEEAGLYYYLLDLEENWPGNSHREPAEPKKIWWRGDALDNLVEHPSALPEAHRYIAPPPNPKWVNHDPPVVNEPRRYTDPHRPRPPN